MNDSKILLSVIVAAVVFGPIIFKLVLNLCQKIDYKRQLDGVIPERKYQGENPDADLAKEFGSNDISRQQLYKESCDADLRMRGMQNLMGPK